MVEPIRAGETRGRRPYGITGAALAPLTGRSDRRGLLQLGCHLTALALAAALVWQTMESLWVVPAMLLQGIIQVALFAPLHECVHRTAFKNLKLNKVVAAVIGVIHVLPASYFRRFHLAHHRFTQEPGRDPELALAKPVDLGGYLVLVSALPYWIGRARELLRHAAGRIDLPFIPAAEHRLIAWEARLHVAIYGLALLAGVLGGSLAPFLFWFGPAILGQPFLRLYLLAEHTGCATTRDMTLNSRTTASNAIVRRLMWNMPYHIEHHAFPGVPFHALPALHRKMKAQLRVTAPGYGRFHLDYIAALLRGRGQAFVNPEPAAEAR